MSKRLYNVFFNTHTVSGIVISVALYIIFFAGAFSLFKDEIKIWEEGIPFSKTKRQDIKFDNLFDSLDSTYNLTGRDLQINLGGESDKIYIFMSESKDSLSFPDGSESDYFSIDINSKETKTYQEHYNLGEFLYRLHFLQQLPYLGIYLAGFVSLFFLFAIITGVIVHWEKIIQNFYYFNPKIALKRVWTDAHTALGIIGLPFQFIFAVTGAYFCLSALVLLPASILYNMNQDKLMEDMRPSRKIYQWQATEKKDVPSFEFFANDLFERWEDFHLTRAFIKNYGGTNMKYFISGELKEKNRFIGVGSISYDAHTGNIEEIKDPHKLSYIEDSQFVFGRLHYGDFGGLIVKTIYFVLSLITCFVIISGVLIWTEARNKKSMTMRQRRYTAKVGHIYLAICLSMLPVTALSFIFSKIAHGHFSNKMMAIYGFYFITWLVFIFFFRFKRDNYLTNKYCLLLGAIFGFSVPLTNGITSGNWLWHSLPHHHEAIYQVDLLWIFTSIISLFCYLKIKPSVKDNSSFRKFPVEYSKR